jgi:hypothetical protein
MLVQFFFSEFLVWLPWAFSLVTICLVIIKCFFTHVQIFTGLKKLSFLYFVWLLIGATIFFDLSLSIIQYFIWKSSEFSQFLLPPYQSWRYFLSYIFMRFWIADILSLFPAVIFYTILNIFQKYRSDIISKDELSLTLLLCLLLGWPQSIIFVFIFLIFTIALAGVNLILFKKKNITLLPSLIISAIAVFMFGNFLISICGLSILNM